MLVFDCETNGFLEKLDRIHCLIIKDTETGEVIRCNDHTTGYKVGHGVMLLQQATMNGQFICGANIIKFDIPALQKIYPWFKPDYRYVRDTIVLTRLIWPDLKHVDHRLVKKGKLPAQHSKKHSLEAWGYRLGVFKDEYAGDPAIEDKKERFERRWESWNQTMEDYCVQDVVATDALRIHCEEYLAKKGFSQESVELEHHVARILARQERYGFAFDVSKAEALTQKLMKERVELEQALREQFGAFYVKAGHVVTKRTARYQVEELGVAGYDKKGNPKYKVMEFTEGAAYTKVKHVLFNPGSRDHVANRLKTLFDWEPIEFTNEGKPKVDDQVLLQLSYPGIESLKKYFVVEKRIGQIAEGKEAWLKHVRNGRIHGAVNPNGAVTGRMTHSKPNGAQVPANHSPYGRECRECWTVTPVASGVRKVLVGADAAALELRDLAGYMARFDQGDYVGTVLNGDKAQGTDMHSVNARALGLDPKAKYFDGESGRDVAKTWFYAFIYGAGDEKLGVILTRKKGQAAIAAGRKARKDFMRNLPALGKLVERVKAAVKERGRLVGLDGRILEVRSQHSALNTLLQSAGAVQMKKALCILDDGLQARGLIPGQHYEFVANVHDEWQIEADEDKGETIGKAAVEAIIKAGEHFKFKCPLDGEWRTGRSWAETH